LEGKESSRHWKGKKVVDIHALGPTEKRVTLDASLTDGGRVPAMTREARRGQRQAVRGIVALHDGRQRLYILDENLSNVSQVKKRR
jgi:hypothetical protein